MKRTLAGFLGTGILTLALVAPAQVQGRGYVGFGGGLSIPVGDFSDAFKMGWLGQVVAGITGPSGRFGGRIDGMYIDRKSTRLNSSHSQISYAVFCLKKKKKIQSQPLSFSA